MHHEIETRRAFLGRSLGAVAGGSLIPWVASSAAPAMARSTNGRPRVAAIGTGWRPDIKRVGRGTTIAKQATEFADVVAICDVDRIAAEYGREKITGGKADLYEDYRDVLARDDIDAVLIGTPDHWHAKIAIEAVHAGKDVYCEKPLTLTIEEGQQICLAVKQTGRVVQVGTQQRSEFDGRFLKAVALVQQGRIGKVRRVSIGLERGEAGGPFTVTKPPVHLNWEKWLGPAPEVPYIKQRCHWTFRWWFEYSGGKLTDWGAHHVDIAQWAIGMQDSGPVSIEGHGTFAQPLKDGMPTRPDTYNTAVEFQVTCRFSNGVEMVIHDGENGILFEGDSGRFFVNRGRLVGVPVDELAQRPLPEDAVEKLCKGQQAGNHMQNFFECLETRQQPISDVFTHHRTLTTCHLANLCLRLGRPLKWDPESQRFVDDRQADAWLQRAPREGYEVQV